MTRLRNAVFLLLVGALTLAPGLAVIAHFLPGMDGLFTNSSLYGQTVASTPPDFSLTSIASGKGQLEVTSWLSKRMGMPRDLLIRVTNSIDFLLGRSANPQIIVGRRGELFTSEMLGDLCIPHDERKYAAEIARGLKQSQDIIRGMGKGFIVVLSPNKAAVQPEHIPSYCTPQSERLYTQMVSFLQSEGVAFVDSEKLAAQSRSDGMPNWFGQYGQHWNTVGLFYAMEEVLKKLRQQTSKPLGVLKIDGLTIDDQPVGNEADTGLLSNFAFDLHPPTPHAKLAIIDARDGLTPLVVGTSFSDGLCDELIKSKVASRVVLYNYFHWIFRYRSPNEMREPTPGDAEQQYPNALGNADSVILEVNASAMRSSHVPRFIAATAKLR